MKTEDLISLLATQPAIAPNMGPEARLGPALLFGGAVTVLLFMLVLGPRSDLAAALAQPVVLAKTLLPLVLGCFAIVLALRMARPGAPLRWSRWLIWAVPGVTLALLGTAFVTAAPAQRLALFLGHSIPVCLPAIFVLSLPLLVAMIRALQRGAPVHPARCGALAGLAAAGLATTLYSLFCTEDSPLFYGVWYSLGICLTAGAGALAGARWLRW
ncbi:DUF1109 domain-containing protein [Pseudooceanicola sediminis]|uniref:DUF1109 domain-containing protein n=1 Tax=Pseudooceanicola sediminis TaxID=2211117 RepID=A0A399J3K5_9RHOB|nr:DUF1109 domain-containing protein [Pseudooceanicola sediminis]KAA2314141.1 DUF1109 domain-containing protein [Puniceibacterium sp. HSS470]RII39998.1 DUF1109 domain-containing protein [Pseudooceanicola sediminis]